MLEEQEQILVIDNFKTMNRKVKEELLPHDILQTCQNLRYDEILGMLYKRSSRRKYNSVTLGDDPITSQTRYYKNSNATQYYVIATSTFLKVGTDSAGTFANIKTGLTANKRFQFLTFKDFLYCFNGVDNNQVYDGVNNCVDMGVPVPTAPTLALGGTGVLTGAYYYKVTYMIDSYQEGSASAASSVISPSSQSITVTIPTSSNTRVTHRKIYRSKAGGTTYYLLATISNNTATTYSDNTADNLLPVTLAPTDYGAPASYRYGVLHKSRIFLARNSANKSDIIFSDIRNGVSYPDVFPENNVLRIAQDDGDEITGIAEDNVGNLVVWKNNSVRIIHTDGDSPKGWSIGKPISNFGNVSPYFLVKTPIGVVYMSRFGKNKNRLMLWSGVGVKHILEEVDPILEGIDQSLIDNTVGHFHNGIIYISYTDTSELDISDIAIDSNTKLLLHGNGTDGSTTITDSSDSAHIVTANDNTQINTAQKALGTGSILFDGTGDYASIPDHADFELLSANWTFDFRIRFSGFDAGFEGIFEHKENTNNYYGVYYYNTSNLLYFNTVVAGSNTVYFNISWAPVINTWYHIEICRYGTGQNNIYVFIDGIPQTINWTNNLAADYSFPNFAGGFNIGWVESAGYLAGRIDEFRLSSVARHTSSFTPPTLEYGYGYNNKVLLINAETLSMIDIDDKAIDSFSSWNSGIDVGELYSGSSNTDGFCYEEETNTSASETTIEINAKWGKLNFSRPRLRKRLKQVKIEFERTVASGTLSYFYSLDGVSETQIDIALSTYASQGYYLYDFPYNTYCFHIQPRLYSNSDISSLKIKRLTYIYNYEPYLPTI